MSRFREASIYGQGGQPASETHKTLAAGDSALDVLDVFNEPADQHGKGTFIKKHGR